MLMQPSRRDVGAYLTSAQPFWTPAHNAFRPQSFMEMLLCDRAQSTQNGAGVLRTPTGSGLSESLDRLVSSKVTLGRPCASQRARPSSTVTVSQRMPPSKLRIDVRNERTPSITAHCRHRMMKCPGHQERNPSDAC